MNDFTLAKCTRCRNAHKVSERLEKQCSGWTESVCPRCGGKSWYDCTPQVAWCWASGLIEIGSELPSPDAIEIARGPKYALETAISVAARHGKGAGVSQMLVPGVPEAPDQATGLRALQQWLEWRGRFKSRDGVVFSKGVA
ncbi:MULTISPECIES: hypothetical protein [Delftia]|uniref:hypothetical protein n=1 Tax=Delftia TaxID=80865 RepID=UPI000353A846|nr:MULTISPECIES: hypothetical protein [Delftia]EPD44433.1 hypothetical protein HMPREF9701_00013 [Delftia acidovorans CCUG 274B]MDR6731180.1 hypothetical protein [Delftia lacustris]WEL96577.1 hypothetical protein PW274_21215 [Delftia tsuruhatensis]